MFKIIKIMLIFIFSIFISCCHLTAGELDENSIIEKFNSIDFHDQQEIKLLFRELFFENSFAYSLFGDKPVTFSNESFTQYATLDEIVSLLSLYGYCQAIIEPYLEPIDNVIKRCDIWNKYKEIFDFKNYILLLKPNDEKPKVLIINKKAFADVFHKNIDLFKKYIGHSVTSANLIHEITTSDKSIFGVLQHREDLVGILLGFGAHNAMLFKKREDWYDYGHKCLRKPEIIKAKIDKFNVRLKSLYKYDPCMISTHNRVGFAADHSHPETAELKQKYYELSKKITEIYSKDDWFEQTLIQLASD